MAQHDDLDFKNSNEPKYSDSELGTLRKQLQMLNAMAGTASLGASVSLAREATASNIFTEIQSMRAEVSSEAKQDTQITRLGTNGDAASATGSQAAQLRQLSADLSSLLTELQLKADLTESQPILDDGPNEQPTVKNLVGVSLGSAQELVPALGAGLKGQIRDLIPSVDTDVKVSIYSGASTLFVGNLKAANGSIQLTPRQGFTGEANTAINMIATTASGTHDTTVNYVSVS